MMIGFYLILLMENMKLNINVYKIVQSAFMKILQKEFANPVMSLVNIVMNHIIPINVFHAMMANFYMQDHRQKTWI